MRTCGSNPLRLHSADAADFPGVGGQEAGGEGITQSFPIWGNLAPVYINMFKMKKKPEQKRLIIYPA